MLMSIGVWDSETNLVAVKFDMAGNYLNILKKDFSEDTLVAAENSQWSGWDTYLHALDDWAEELDLEKGVIAVKKLSLPEIELRIVDIPFYYQQMVENGEDLDEEILENIEYWREVNDFVLVWGQDFDMDKDGKIVST